MTHGERPGPISLPELAGDRIPASSGVCDDAALLRVGLQAVVALALAVSAPAHAEPAGAGATTSAGERTDEAVEAPAEPRETPARPGVLATSVAAVPGAVLSGAGHWVAGDRQTARKLLALRGIGLAVAAAGGVPLWLTRAARRTSGVPIGLMIAGSGMFLIPWLADIYGSAGGAGIGGQPRMEVPDLELSIGYGYLRDPQFAHDHLTEVGVWGRRGPWRVSTGLVVAADANNQRATADVTYRLRGPGARPSGDGSFVEFLAGAAYHRYGDDDFWVGSSEIQIKTRLDLLRIGDSLSGSFADMSLGLGYERTRFEIPGAGADISDMLLGRFAFGFYLGRRGELAGYYDHRRDVFVAGLSPGKENGSGFLGHFGVGGVYTIGRGIGATADYAAGGSHLFRVGLRYSLGGR